MAAASCGKILVVVFWLARKKLQFANPQVKIQENVPIEAVSFRRIVTVEQLQLEHTRLHTHTKS